MWTINPIQDYIDMFEGLRSQNAKADMINVPGSTDGCWVRERAALLAADMLCYLLTCVTPQVYRCHKRMEDLISDDNFNGFFKKLLGAAKRGATY